nr:Hypothetical protein FSTVLC9_159 [Faustovirus]
MYQYEIERTVERAIKRAFVYYGYIAFGTIAWVACIIAVGCGTALFVATHSDHFMTSGQYKLTTNSTTCYTTKTNAYRDLGDTISYYNIHAVDEYVGYVTRVVYTDRLLYTITVFATLIAFGAKWTHDYLVDILNNL